MCWAASTTASTSSSPHDVPLVDATSGKVNRRSLVSRSGNRIELLDAPRGPSGVRLATGDKQLEVTLDERKGEIALKVFARGTSWVLSPSPSAGPGSRSTPVRGT